MRIVRLKHSEIDFEKYDKCIIASSAANTYALSWYLNIVSPSWALLMADDYSVVMPLPQKKKFCLTYITQPYFCQQLGVFSKQNLDKDTFNEFINTVPYKYMRMQLNISNVFDLPADKLRPDFVLDLSKDFDNLYSSFSSNCKKNIKKAISFNQEIKEIGVDEFMILLSTNEKGLYSDFMLQLQKKIIIESLKNGSGRLLSAYDDNRLIAAVFVIYSGSRIYYLCPVSSAEGKQKHSMSLLVNEIIARNAGTDKILDFEGSSISGVAKFYAGFGAKPEFYPVWNRIKLF